MIIGVSGLNGAGKGALVSELSEHGFSVHSLSDVIRQKLSRLGLEETRERMIEEGRNLRRAGGPGALAQGLVAQFEVGGRYAIDSIRHPAEVDVLAAQSGGFKLIWVQATEAIRFQRMQERGRPGDPASLEELRTLEARELGSPDAAAQQLLAVRDRADLVLDNDGERSTLHALAAPLWDEG